MESSGARSASACSANTSTSFDTPANPTVAIYARVAATEERLRDETREQSVVLINHFPLRYDLVRLRRIPRFSIWCGTRRTEDWHLRFGAEVVVSGHLHVPRTEWRDGVRFEEVSLGYPRERKVPQPPESYLRRIL